jgi:hypothetical protein
MCLYDAEAGNFSLIHTFSIFDVVTIKPTVWCQMIGWKKIESNMELVVGWFKELC